MIRAVRAVLYGCLVAAAVALATVSTTWSDSPLRAGALETSDVPAAVYLTASCGAFLLYLAALFASRHNRDMKLFRQHLSAEGKAPKVCLIAIARKLVVLANTLITENRQWQPAAPQNA